MFLIINLNRHILISNNLMTDWNFEIPSWSWGHVLDTTLSDQYYKSVIA